VLVLSNEDVARLIDLPDDGFSEDVHP